MYADAFAWNGGGGFHTDHAAYSAVPQQEDEWDEAFDWETSTKYYFNVRTRESSWVKPMPPQSAPAPSFNAGLPMELWRGSRTPQLPLPPIGDSLAAASSHEAWRGSSEPTSWWPRALSWMRTPRPHVTDNPATMGEGWAASMSSTPPPRRRRDDERVEERSPGSEATTRPRPATRAPPNSCTTHFSVDSADDTTACGFDFSDALDDSPDSSYSPPDMPPPPPPPPLAVPSCSPSRLTLHRVAGAFFFLGLFLGLLLMAGFSAQRSFSWGVRGGAGGHQPASPALFSAGAGLDALSPTGAFGDDSDASPAKRSERGRGITWSGRSVQLDCLPGCGGRPGWCDWCGHGKACCRADSESNAPECKGSGGEGYHECTTIFANIGEQCGGVGWSGAQNCTAGYTCREVREDYWECQPHLLSVVAQDYYECGWVQDGQVWEALCNEGSACRRIDATRSLCLSEGLRHPGEDCFHACGKVSGDCIWCGAGNACCRANARPGEDPPECSGVDNFLTKHHECVVPVSPVLVQHQGQDCWPFCGIGGDCAWCGKGNACCRQGFDQDPSECSSVISFPAAGSHTCVAPVTDVPVKHEGQACLHRCDGKAGYCDWCGKGTGACCIPNALSNRMRGGAGGVAGPTECEGVQHVRQTEWHVCVRASIEE
eukprot:TRINITY_DN26862_c0_g2_i1.p1 TRINITY_DN26862_c0_g2~~TRINITY_DN26862_c0_g2_i1.p1  ORF type:complete len:656 (+),score=68.31 TRINITY_DN26862_c0_g2_i1:142-2109(+)